jgi:hypothetical protein
MLRWQNCCDCCVGTMRIGICIVHLAAHEPARGVTDRA